MALLRCFTGFRRSGERLAEIDLRLLQQRLGLQDFSLGGPSPDTRPPGPQKPNEATHSGPQGGQSSLGACPFFATGSTFLCGGLRQTS